MCFCVLLHLLVLVTCMHQKQQRALITPANVVWSLRCVAFAYFGLVASVWSVAVKMVLAVGGIAFSYNCFDNVYIYIFFSILADVLHLLCQ